MLFLYRLRQLGIAVIYKSVNRRKVNDPKHAEGPTALVLSYRFVEKQNMKQFGSHYLLYLMRLLSPIPNGLQYFSRQCFCITLCLILSSCAVRQSAIKQQGQFSKMHNGHLFVMIATIDYSRILSILSESGLKPVILFIQEETTLQYKRQQFVVAISWQNEAQLNRLQSQLFKENLVSEMVLTCR